MPCTSICFDPSSNLAVAMCATRSIVFLSPHQSTLSMQGKRGSLGKNQKKKSAGVCSDLFTMFINSLIVVCLLILVTKYNEFTTTIEYTRFS